MAIKKATTKRYTELGVRPAPKLDDTKPKRKTKAERRFIKRLVDMLSNVRLVAK